MSTRSRSRSTLGLAVAGGIAALVLAGCASTSSGTGAGSGGGTTSGSTSGAAASPSIVAGDAVGTEQTSLGTVLVDPQGKTLYMFEADSPGQSHCTGTCLQYWPLVAATAAMPKAPAGVTATLGSITRSDGTKQLTVDNWPAYTYRGDTAVGMTAGQGTNLSGGLWWVLGTDGKAVKSGSTGGSPGPSASKSTGGGYHY
jgi:predicted lipoprotein with Yx(FWY)xxD motif